MDPVALSLLVAALVLVPLILAGVQIGITLGITGMVGIAVFTGGNLTAMLSQPFIQSLDVGMTYAFIVIPLFIALGTIAGQSGITSDLFTAFSRWVGHVPGGIAVATIGTSAGLASVTGSSLGASAAMAKLAMPELRRFRYQDRLSAGAVSMGGTIAAMIPPSITMVLYGIFSETSIGKMLIAGVLPGLMTCALYALKISVRCKLNPKLGPPGPRFSWRERLQTLPPILPFFLIVFAIIGGILFGVWTPVESGRGRGRHGTPAGDLAPANDLAQAVLCACRRRHHLRLDPDHRGGLADLLEFSCAFRLLRTGNERDHCARSATHWDVLRVGGRLPHHRHHDGGGEHFGAYHPARHADRGRDGLGTRSGSA